MFKRLFEKSKEIERSFVLYAFADGQIIDIKDVDDEVFSSGMLGKGIAIEPSKGCIYSPCCGQISHIFETKHAMNIISDFGCEILIHIGIDTVKLNGEYFDIKVKEGDFVNNGDLLCEFDIDSIKSLGFKTTTPLVVSNGEIFKKIEVRPKCEVSVGNSIIRIVK